ncbi:MAG: hypothetical protein KKC55_16940 [Gammaproteobacteria bacterium]|nr:hypothetical protein [Gammaproteobacteria bacterium]
MHSEIAIQNSDNQMRSLKHIMVGIDVSEIISFKRIADGDIKIDNYLKNELFEYHRETSYKNNTRGFFKILFSEDNLDLTLESFGLDLSMKLEYIVEILTLQILKIRRRLNPVKEVIKQERIFNI